MIITPTVGRIVWLRDATAMPEEQPTAAIVIRVHSDRRIAVVTFKYCAGVVPCEIDAHDNVPLLQEGDPEPTEGIFAVWMPYQIGQAKRHLQQGEVTT